MPNLIFTTQPIYVTGGPMSVNFNGVARPTPSYFLPIDNAVSRFYISGGAALSTINNEVWTSSGSPVLLSGVGGWPDSVGSLNGSNFYQSASIVNNGQFSSGQSHTIALLMKWGSLNGLQQQFFTDGQGGGNGWILRDNANGLGYFRGSTELLFGSEGGALVSGSRYLAMFGMNGTTMTAQVNQRTIQSLAGVSSPSGSKFFRIGTSWDNLFSFPNGLIYEAAIYDYAPTSSSMAAIYSAVISRGVTLG